jgi:hypothetical protein
MAAVLQNRLDLDMAAPSAFNPAQHSQSSTLTSSTVTGTANSDRVLVVGSMEAAQTGQYQQVIEKAGMGGIRQVEMYMIDRLTDGASSLQSSSYSGAHLILPFSYLTSSAIFTRLHDAITPEGTLTIESPSTPDDTSVQQVQSNLAQTGFTDVQVDGTVITAKSKPSSSSTNMLPLRRKLGNKATTSSNKKALWSVTAAQDAPLIDQNSLLSEAEKRAPSAARRDDCDIESAMKAGSKKKKACKGCTCGLRELEEEEEQSRQASLSQGIVQLDASDMDMPEGSKGLEKTEVTETMVDEHGITRVIKRVKVDTSGATSSCGSCFLGDAFRCSSCAYLGECHYLPR